MMEEQVDYDETNEKQQASDSPGVLSGTSQRAAMEGMTGTLSDRGEEIEDLGSNPYQESSSDHYRWNEEYAVRKRKREVESMMSKMLRSNTSVEDVEHFIANSIRKRTMTEGPSIPTGGAAVIRNVVTGDLAVLENLASLEKVEQAQQRMEGLKAQGITTSVKNYLSARLVASVENNDIKNLPADILEGDDDQVIWDALKTKARAQQTQAAGGMVVDGTDVEKRLRGVLLNAKVLYNEQLFTEYISELRKIEVAVPIVSAVWVPLRSKLETVGSKSIFSNFGADQQEILISDMKKKDRGTLRLFINGMRDVGFKLQDEHTRSQIMSRLHRAEDMKAGGAVVPRPVHVPGPIVCWTCGRSAAVGAPSHTSANCRLGNGVHPDANVENCEWAASTNGMAWAKRGMTVLPANMTLDPQKRGLIKPIDNTKHGKGGHYYKKG